MRCITANVLQTNKVDAQCDKRDQTKLTTLRAESRQFPATAPAFNPPHLHLAPPFGVTAVEFCRGFQQQKTKVPGLSCSVVCMILRLDV